MTIEELFAILSEMHPLTKGLKKDLRKELIALTLPRNHILLEAPKVQDHLYFLCSGFAMSFVFEDARKVIHQFWAPGSLLISFPSFFDQTPSTEYIQLMEKCELYCIRQPALVSLLKKRKVAQVLFSFILQKELGKKLLQIQDFKRQSAIQRFESLVDVYPMVEQVIPQEHIASWLGITPQSLSRLKHKK